jgi:hypothetical protein
MPSLGVVGAPFRVRETAQAEACGYKNLFLAPSSCSSPLWGEEPDFLHEKPKPD